MARILLDNEIKSLLEEAKILPRNWKQKFAPRSRAGKPSYRRSLRITGEGGNRFRIDIRDHSKLLFDFSIILSFIDHDDEEYILIRFNGKHPSDHTNKWEKKHQILNHRFRNSFISTDLQNDTSRRASKLMDMQK